MLTNVAHKVLLRYVRCQTGVTPIIGILRDIFVRQSSNQAHLVQHVYVTWSVQHFDQFSWVADDLAACLAAPSTSTSLVKASGGPSLNISVHATRQIGPNPYARRAVTGQRATLSFNSSRPNLRESLTSAVDHAGRDHRAFVFACGPSLMVREVWDHVTHLRHRGYQVDFHREMFEL